MCTDFTSGLVVPKTTVLTKDDVRIKDWSERIAPTYFEFMTYYYCLDLVVSGVCETLTFSLTTTKDNKRITIECQDVHKGAKGSGSYMFEEDKSAVGYNFLVKKLQQFAKAFREVGFNVEFAQQIRR